MITIATPPIIVAWTTARSALSAKNSMNTKIDAPVRHDQQPNHLETVIAEVDVDGERLRWHLVALPEESSDQVDGWLALTRDAVVWESRGG